MRHTPLNALRLQAPGSLKLADIAAYFRKHRFARTEMTISHFELGRFQKPPDRFIELYASAVGQSEAVVRAALERTQKMRKAMSGPFDRKSAA